VLPSVQFEAQTVMYRWFNDYGYEADFSALREKHGVPSSSISTSVPTAGRLLKLLHKVDVRSPGVARSCTIGA